MDQNVEDMTVMQLLENYIRSIPTEADAEFCRLEVLKRYRASGLKFKDFVVSHCLV